ncbi:MAG: TOMM precursor leader peptide-binding protein [Deltaproteobacteria bacterium]
MAVRPRDPLGLQLGVSIHAVRGRDPDGVPRHATIVLGAREPTLLFDTEPYSALLAALTEPRTPIELARALEHVADAPHVHVAIRRLVELGVAAPCTSTDAPHEVIAPTPHALTVLTSLDLSALERDGRAAAHAGRPWTFVLRWGGAVWLGPQLAPDGRPCVDCLVDRLRHTQPVLAYVTREGDAPRSAAPDERLLQLAAEHGRSRPTDEPAVLVRLELETGEATRHSLHPTCARCGPDDTSLEALVDPVLGVIARAEVVTVDAPFVCFAVTPRCPPAGEAPSAEAFFRTSSGKGATAEAARRGAIAEALERRAATWAGQCAVRATYRELEARAVHPAPILQFSEAQYQARASGDTRPELDPRRRVPPRFDEDAPISWVSSRSLATGSERMLPSALVFLDERSSPTFCYDDPNGLGAGATRAQATLHALLELVERDAVALWWYTRALRPAIDRGGIDADAARWWTHLEHHGSVAVLDLTSDFEIPVFAALRHGPGAPRVGFGCHLDGRVALRRCLAELAQSCAARPSPRADEDWSAAKFLVPHGEPRDVSPFEATEDDALPTVVSRLAAHGYDPLVVDLPPPGGGLHVVRAVVPGLRHFWPRFGPGRLYATPVALGWIDAAPSEATLNPLPVLW